MEELPSRKRGPGRSRSRSKCQQRGRVTSKSQRKPWQSLFKITVGRPHPHLQLGLGSAYGKYTFCLSLRRRGGSYLKRQRSCLQDLLAVGLHTVPLSLQMGAPVPPGGWRCVCQRLSQTWQCGLGVGRSADGQPCVLVAGACPPYLLCMFPQ